MCGIVGLFGRSAVGERIHDALTMLQHRGQDAAGIATAEAHRLHLRTGIGLVADVFQASHIMRLTGNVGIGHVRYPTAGTPSVNEAQPMYVNSPYGIALGHNGNLINADELKRELFEQDRRHLNTDSDSEILLNVLAHELARQRAATCGPEEVFGAVAGVHARCRGAYSVVALIVGCGLLAFRDPFGIRPLIIGRRDEEKGTEYMIASESVALDLLRFRVVRDVAPGEAVFIDGDGVLHSRVCAPRTQLTPCIFEHVYLARPDAIMDNVSVYRTRLRMGERLADHILERFPNGHDIDVVIPIPDTGRTAALPLANRLNVKYREGFIKNPYVGRTFIMPGQNQRKRSARNKYNTIGLEFRGKNVLLVEDSIVRGTTISQIIDMAREAGARSIGVAIASPPVRFPNVYGIDMPAAHELVAATRSEEEVARLIGADWLIYQRLSDLVECAREGNRDIARFDCSVFDGEYVTGDVTAEYLCRLSELRHDEAKTRRAEGVSSGRA